MSKTYWSIDKDSYFFKPRGAIGYFLTIAERSEYDPDALIYNISQLKFSPLSVKEDYSVNEKIDLLLTSLKNEKEASVSLNTMLSVVNFSLTVFNLFSAMNASPNSNGIITLVGLSVLVLVFVIHKMWIGERLNRLEAILRIIRGPQV